MRRNAWSQLGALATILLSLSCGDQVVVRETQAAVVTVLSTVMNNATTVTTARWMPALMAACLRVAMGSPAPT